MLFIVPTPIGNLEDITFRAVRILKEVDLILAEDTRVAFKLLKHYSITNIKVQSYHLNNEHRKTKEAVNFLCSGKKIALITDAGTPSISDPGYLLVRESVEKKIKIECLPGATAFIPAIVLSALPCEKFIYEGFLPHKKGRQSKLKKILDSDITTVFYESTHRILKTLAQLVDLDKDRQISVSRELTKIYEETVRGSVLQVHEYYLSNSIKGEFVVVISGKKLKNRK